MLKRELGEKLTKEQLIELIVAYDNYIKDFDEEFQRLDRTPICISEFLNNEFINGVDL